MHCHAMSCLSCMSTCSNTKMQTVWKLSSWGAVRDQLQGVKEIAASSQAFAAIRDDGSVVTWRNKAGSEWSMRQNLQHFFLPFAFLKRVRFLLHHATFSNYSRLKIRKTKHVVDRNQKHPTDFKQTINDIQTKCVERQVLAFISCRLRAETVNEFSRSFTQLSRSKVSSFGIDDQPIWTH